MLSHERVCQLLNYDPEIGVLVWKVSLNKRIVVGRVAGSVNKNRLMVKIEGRDYIGSRLIWFWVTGSWPNGEIDHKDRDSLNNRWSNLRDVPQCVNAQNHSKQTNNKSGVVGVSWHKASQKWHSQITLGRKQIYLGVFEDFDTAVSVRKAAELKLFQLPEGVK